MCAESSVSIMQRPEARWTNWLRYRHETLHARTIDSNATNLIVDPFLILLLSVAWHHHDLIILVRILHAADKLETSIVALNLAQFAQHEILVQHV